MIYQQPNGPFDLLSPTKIYVGIDTNTFNYSTAAQLESNFCWAASLQMVSNFYGLDINQWEFAHSNCGIDSDGRIRNCPASVEEITTHLNVCSSKLCLHGDVNYGVPDLNRLYSALAENLPVILAYNTGNIVGHAVVLTGMTLERPLLGNVELKSVIVRDPWPSYHNKQNAGRIEYFRPMTDLLNHVHAWWVPTPYRKPARNSIRVIG